MDSLETVSRFVDDFLNFSPDIDAQNLKEQNPQTQDEEEEESYQKPPQNPSLHTQTQLDILEGDVDSFPVVGEEELEWLLNENAFPPVEEPFAFSLQSPKHQSPVSVLESGFRVRVRARSQRQRRKQFGVLGIFGKWGGEGKKRAVLEETKRKCSHCAAEKTPQWRAGPLGPKTLCNACGVRYKAGRLVPEYRPASSPSFSSDLHSNSHRKILEMRKKKQKALENG